LFSAFSVGKRHPALCKGQAGAGNKLGHLCEGGREHEHWGSAAFETTFVSARTGAFPQKNVGWYFTESTDESKWCAAKLGDE